MPYKMMHLVSAWMVLQGGDEVTDHGAFYLGASAPDAVQLRPDFTYAMKEASHCWRCGPQWGDTQEPEKWRRDILALWQQKRNGAERDYWAGYCAHLLTDLINDLRVWSPARKQGLQQGEGWEAAYRAEFAAYDTHLYHTWALREEVFQLVREAEPVPFDDVVTVLDIEALRAELFSAGYFGARDVDVSQHRWCREDVMTHLLLSEAPIAIRAALFER